MIGIAILFITLGISIKYKKMYSLIAGYNTMSKEEKAKYDIKKIVVIFRNTMFGMAVMVIVGCFLTYYLKKPMIEIYFLLISILVGMTYLLLASNSKKIKKTPKY